MPKKSKLCFLIAPIRKAGTDEYEYFRALRDTVIEPVLRGLSYEVIRADDIAKGGAITADIVRHLADADVVVADLTGHNANVFYELGIRHALRANGTVMIVDTGKSEVPFDLKPYRVIEFTGDLRGIEKLRQGLVDFTCAIDSSAAENEYRDNPVHDFLPSLPDNIFRASTESVEGELRSEIAQLRDQLRHWGIDSVEKRDQALTDVVAVALAQAQRAELPIDLFQRAREACRKGDRATFLTLLQQLAEAKAWVLSAEQWTLLAKDAVDLSLPDEVRFVVHDRAIELKPADRYLRMVALEGRAHSANPVHRERAREDLLALLGIRINEDGHVNLPDNFSDDELGSLAVMLDAFHTDGLNDEAYKITSALATARPTSTLVLRNHARALAKTDRPADALDYYRRALLASDVDDTTAVWFGNMLANSGRRIDSIEAYLFACKLDPDDGANFAQVAGAMNFALRDAAIGKAPLRPLPDSMTPATIAEFLHAAFSCPTLSADAYNYAISVIHMSELGSSFARTLAALRGAVPSVDGDEVQQLAPRTRPQRVELVNATYAMFQSELTVPGADEMFSVGVAPDHRSSH